MKLHLRLASAIAGLLLAGTAFAAYPGFTATTPSGGQRGTDVKVSLRGDHLTDFDGLVFMSPGFTLKSTDKVQNTQVDVTLSIAKEVPPGLHMLRIRTKSGISHFRPFYVGQFPNAEEKEPNNDFDAPQPAQLNQTIEGVVQNEDVDYYKINVKKGQRISVEAEALRLANGVFDTYIAVLDKNKFELAFADDSILFRQDGYLNFTAPEDGDYVVMIRESSYRGNANSKYRLHIGTFRRPEVVYPAGGKVGSTTKVRFIERDGQSFSEDVALPAEPNDRLLLLSKSQEPAPNGNPFRVVSFDNALEAEPNDDQAHATPAPSGQPIALNGILETKGDVDYFKVPLKKGMKLDVIGYAQALGSPLDPVVNVYNAKGSSLGGNDDGGGRRRLDSKLTVNIPADGDYFVRVTDQLERGGPTFMYRIEMTASQPAIFFSSPEYSVNDTHLRQFAAVPRGGRYAALVNISRNNAPGDFKWEAPGLPAGVKLLNDVAPKDYGSMPLLYEAAPDAPLGGAPVSVKLTPTDPNLKITGAMRQTFDMVRAGNVIYYTEVEDQVPVAVVEEAPYSLEITKPTVPLVAGGLMELKVVAKLKEGFTKPIRVFMIWKPPGISSLGEKTIPEGQNECVFQLDANGAVSANKWKFTVMGEADAGNGRVYNASPFCEVTTAPAYLTAPAMAMAVVEQGKETELVCKVEHPQAFNGDAEAQVMGVPDTIQIEPGKINKDTKEISFKVKTTDKSPVGKQNNLFVVVKVPVEGGIANHRIGVGSSLRIDAPRKAPATPALAQNTAKAPGAPKPAEAKPLSRLEQLRQEANAAKK
jgi:hypothetical protein